MALSKETLGATTKAADAVTKAAGTVREASDSIGNVRPVVKRIMKDKQTRKALAETLAAGRRVYVKVGSEPRAAARTALNDPQVQRDLLAAIAALRVAAARASQVAERRRRSHTWLWVGGAAAAVLAAIPFLSRRLRSSEPEYPAVEGPMS